MGIEALTWVAICPCLQKINFFRLSGISQNPNCLYKNEIFFVLSRFIKVCHQILAIFFIKSDRFFCRFHYLLTIKTHYCFWAWQNEIFNKIWQNLQEILLIICAFDNYILIFSLSCLQIYWKLIWWYLIKYNPKKKYEYLQCTLSVFESSSGTSVALFWASQR